MLRHSVDKVIENLQNLLRIDPMAVKKLLGHEVHINIQPKHL